MMTLAVKLLKHRATWGVMVSVGILLAVWGNGALRYSAGRRSGMAEERAAWSSEVALARTSAIASQVAADAATSALRDSIRVRDSRIAKLTEAAAMAKGNYRAALVAYERQKAALFNDSIPPLIVTACDELASSCATALAAEATVKDSLTAQLNAAIRLAGVQDSVIRTEPARTTLTVREMLAQQRAAFRGPSRVTWGAAGALIGVAATWIALR